MKKKNGENGSILIKVDFAQAYDSVVEFFGERFIVPWFFGVLDQQILLFISSCTFSIIVYGKSSKEFNAKRGLRQGGPLSPSPFILALNTLSCAINHLTQTKALKPAKISKLPCISHLFFTDDSAFAIESDITNLQCFKDILETFCNESGYKINQTKSCVFPSSNIDSSFISEIGDILRFNVSSDFVKYLGIFFSDT